VGLLESKVKISTQFQLMCSIECFTLIGLKTRISVVGKGSASSGANSLRLRSDLHYERDANRRPSIERVRRLRGLPTVLDRTPLAGADSQAWTWSYLRCGGGAGPWELRQRA
jgi:hypothetical protein